MRQAIPFEDSERSVYDQAVVDALEAIGDGASKKEQQKLATAIGRAAKSVSQVVLTVKPGQRQLRFSTRSPRRRWPTERPTSPVGTPSVGRGRTATLFRVRYRN